jgi:hypothetical protein
VLGHLHEAAAWFTVQAIKIRKRDVELHVDDSPSYLPYAANSSIAHLSIPQNLSKFPEFAGRSG